jgi:hypothetical protein
MFCEVDVREHRLLNCCQNPGSAFAMVDPSRSLDTGDTPGSTAGEADRDAEGWDTRRDSSATAEQTANGMACVLATRDGGADRGTTLPSRSAHAGSLLQPGGRVVCYGGSARVAAVRPTEGEAGELTGLRWWEVPGLQTSSARSCTSRCSESIETPRGRVAVCNCQRTFHRCAAASIDRQGGNG